jgi:hypothetical protein
MVHAEREREREPTVDRGVAAESSSLWAVEHRPRACCGR